MNSIKNNNFSKKAEFYKRELIHTKKSPKNIVTISSDPTAFQQLKACVQNPFNMPITLKSGDSIILDFGDHNVGRLHFSLNHVDGKQITDSPIQLKFSFGEFPLEIITPPESYRGTLGSGWLQNEVRNIVFTPYSRMLERRYSFRYLKIERTDNAQFEINLTDLFADCTSAVDISAVNKPDIKDATLKRIYDIALKTLSQCEQDVFEDGPKRDRRLWIGDLRLQALTDYVTFRNIDLIKRCIYLFAAHRIEDKLVAPYVFPDSPPHIDNWYFADYSLFFISCLYDYINNCDDIAFLEELYPVAEEQVTAISRNFPNQEAFIDWCPDLDKSISFIGVYIYALKQFKRLTEILKKDTAAINSKIKSAEDALLKYYSEEKGLFITASGQISQHSQIWAVLSDTLCMEDNIQLLNNMKQNNPEYGIHTPYMMHYYIEALYKCGLIEEAMDRIKQFWGEIADFHFDCFPEIFNPENHMESPYMAPEINSACHAWSCAPAYWIFRFYNERVF